MKNIILILFLFGVLFSSTFSLNDAYAAIDNPTATASFDDGDSDGSGGTFDELAGAMGITTVVIGSNTYALVASNDDDGVQIIDITTPGSPKDIASFDDGDSDGSGGTFDELEGAMGITTVVIGSNTYALVASDDDDGVQIIDITTPGSPKDIASFDDGDSDGSGGTFDGIEGAFAITTVVIGSNTYALVASDDDGVQIIDITTPGSPTATASFDDGDSDGSGGTFDELNGAKGITTVVIGSNTYALVASHSDDGVQIIDITTPGSPKDIASFDDGDSDGSGGTFDGIEGAFAITTVVIGSNTYALVASLSEVDGVQIIDITTPGSPTATASFADGDSDGSGGTFDELGGAFAITTVVIDSNTYALVVSGGGEEPDDGVQIIELDVVVTADTTSSSDCYDCKPPVLQSSHIRILTNDYVMATGDDPLHITANVGDEIEITLEITDDKSVHLLPTSGIYTNFMERPNDMNLFYANNFDDSHNPSTSFYEWNHNHDDVSYDYADTVMWSSPEISYVEFPVTDETSFEIINDELVIEHFIISFKMKFTDSMESSQVWVSAADYYGQSFKVPLPLILEILGDEPLDFTSNSDQKVLSYFNESVLLSVLSQWSESSNEMSELSSILGVNGELPSWTANLATWTVEEKITPAEMIIAIEYVINHSA